MNDYNHKSHLAPEDNRQEPRLRTLRVAQLVFGGFTPVTLDCLVRDMTDHGARVETPTMTLVPEILWLRLGDGTSLRARRAWAKGTEIGLEFFTPTA